VSQLLVAQRALTVPGWAKDALWRRAQAIPSLDLRFADNKSLVDAVTGQQLVTFTRASSGTFVGSNGVLQTAVTDAPRFDHNPTTGESLGLLVEEQRTNLLLQSEDFSTTWSRPQSDTITTNSISSPAGTATADSFVENSTASSLHTILQDATITANATYTVSLYVKAALRTEIQFKLSDAADASGVTGTFNLSTGAATSGSFGTGSANVASMQTLPNAWYRCVLTGALGGSITALRLRVRPLSSGSDVYTGSGQTALYLWGAQLE
jgi:hypothetical protein